MILTPEVVAGGIVRRRHHHLRIPRHHRILLRLIHQDRQVALPRKHVQVMKMLRNEKDSVLHPMGVEVVVEGGLVKHHRLQVPRQAHQVPVANKNKGRRHVEHQLVPMVLLDHRGNGRRRTRHLLARRHHPLEPQHQQLLPVSEYLHIEENPAMIHTWMTTKSVFEN